MWGLSFITNINWCQTRRIGGVIGAAENGVGGPTTSEILLSADKSHDDWAIENNCQHECWCRTKGGVSGTLMPFDNKILIWSVCKTNAAWNIKSAWQNHQVDIRIAKSFSLWRARWNQQSPSLFKRCKKTQNKELQRQEQQQLLKWYVQPTLFSEVG